MPHLFAIYGPTASGKSELAEALADLTQAQLINADAFMVYRGLDIGTNKPTEKDRYKLLDLKAPHEDFGVGEWVRLASDLLGQLHAQSRDAVLVGGTGLYLRALTERWTELAPAPDPGLRAALQRELQGRGLPALVDELRRLDPETKVDLANPVRVTRALERLRTAPDPVTIDYPDFEVVKFGIQVEPAEIDQRIAQRTQEMLIRGWVDEVNALRTLGVSAEAPSMRAIGYRLILEALEGKTSFADLEGKVVQQTRQYAKRQRTWMRSEPHLVPCPSWQPGQGREAAARLLSNLN